jgi:hypothetical protein
MYVKDNGGALSIYKLCIHILNTRICTYNLYTPTFIFFSIKRHQNIIRFGRFLGPDF